MAKGGDTFHWRGFLLPEERERGSGPARQRQSADGSPERLDRGAHRSPCFWSMACGSRLAIQNWHDRNGLMGALLRLLPVIKV
jgi:hypothetical protein